MNDNILPIGDRALIKPDTDPEISKSGLVIVQDTKEKKSNGTILAIGNGEKITKAGVQIGDKVLFDKWGGTYYYTDDNEELLVIDSDKILAIIK